MGFEDSGVLRVKDILGVGPGGVITVRLESGAIVSTTLIDNRVRLDNTVVNYVTLNDNRIRIIDDSNNNFFTLTSPGIVAKAGKTAHVWGNYTTTDNAAHDLIAAAGVNHAIYLVDVVIVNLHASVSTVVRIRDEDGKLLFLTGAAANGGGVAKTLEIPPFTGKNKKLQVICDTTGANVVVQVGGYKDL